MSGVSSKSKLVKKRSRKPIEPNGRCYIYARCSTKMQKEKTSIEVQIELCTNFAKGLEMEVIEIFKDEALSGKTRDNREALKRAIESLKEGDALMFYDLSRMSRSLRDMMDIAIEIHDKGAYFTCVKERIDTSTAQGNMMFQIMGALAEAESKKTAERVTDAMAYRKNKYGTANGQASYGFKYLTERDDKGKTINTTLIEVPEEQEVIQKILELRNTADKYGKYMAHGRIAQELQNLGYLTRRGKDKWCSSTVKSILDKYWDEQ